MLRCVGDSWTHETDWTQVSIVVTRKGWTVSFGSQIQGQVTGRRVLVDSREIHKIFKPAQISGPIDPDGPWNDQTTNAQYLIEGLQAGWIPCRVIRRGQTVR